MRSTEEGVESVLASEDGDMAMVMEGTLADYFVSRRCDLYRVGTLGKRSYSFAFPIGKSNNA